MAEKRTVVVTGATGKQGGAVARALLERGHAVVALTRSPEGAAARSLAGSGARIVRGDFDDMPSLVAAMRGAETLYLMGTPYETGTDAEIAQGLAAIDAARQAGIGHVIYSSVASADRETGIPHFDSKALIERRLAKSGLNWTVLAPVAFMDFLGPFVRDGLRDGEYRMAISPTREVQYVAPDDIGAAAAVLAERRGAVFGQRIEIAGDEKTGEEVAAILSRASGRDIRYVQMPLDAIRAFSADIAAMLEWLDRVGYSVDRQAVTKAFPGIRWRSVEDWAADQDWGNAFTTAA